VERFTSWATLVRAFRRTQRLTQQEAAQLLGVSQPTLSRWEAGRQVPDGRTRRRLRELMETLTGVRRRLLEAIVTQSPVPQVLMDGELRVLGLSEPFARLLDRPAGELVGTHDPARHPLGPSCRDTLARLEHEGLGRGEVAFAECYDMVHDRHGKRLATRQLWVPVETGDGELLVRAEVGLVDEAAYRAALDVGARVRITRIREVVGIPELAGGPRHAPAGPSRQTQT